MKFLTKVGLLQFWVATVLRLKICILSCQKVLINLMACGMQHYTMDSLAVVVCARNTLSCSLSGTT